MIESLALKNVATYDSVGVLINDLKKVNFVYGANGSGKTTVSRFLQNQSDERFIDCSIQWKNGQRLTTLVYNNVFREQNFGKGKLNGVFTIGQATKEDISAIEEKMQQLRAVKDNGVKTKETLTIQIQTKENLGNSFKEDCWIKIYKKYEREFKEAFTGFLSKERFKDKLLQEFKSNAEALPVLDELKEKANILFGEIPENITSLSAISYERILEIEVSAIWKKIIVGKGDVNIAKLIQKLNLNDWVDHGRGFLQETGEICPFCQQQTITESFKNQLEDFFDESYLSDIRSLKEVRQEYQIKCQNLINELNAIETAQKDFPNTKLSISKYSALLKTLLSQNAANSELLNNKIKEPSRSIELLLSAELLNSISELIATANSEINKHNALVANFHVEKNKLIKSIWRFIIEEFRTDINRFEVSNSGLDKGIASLRTKLEGKAIEYKSLDAEIKRLSKNVTSIQPTVDEINRLLLAYGFVNFEIVPAAENGFYQIQREDGAIAEQTLSEGEITFITFLYYLQLSRGGLSEERVNEERVLVIDDPISSLDSNVLFVVSTLVKEIIKNVKNDIGNIRQVILLTHNVYFHKEVSFIDGRTRTCNKTNYWILRKNNKITSVQSFVMDNPIQSSYGLLWQELKSEEIRSSITIQNIMRRIIENYFKLLGKYGDDDLIQKFKTKEEQEICRSLISWINDGSHSINDDLYVEHQGKTIESYRKVFKEIFIVTNHEGHYNMMLA